MDRRQQKTRAAIFKALSTLLEKKSYNSITVQEIIEEANIGRSTFYAHFDTKDQLLKTMCTDIFSHVFDDELMSEETHDFSGKNGLEARLTHLLYHLQEGEQDIIGILSCESGDLFMKYFKEYLTEMFSMHLNEIKVNVPTDFLLNHLVGSFAETVKWWIAGNMDIPPTEVIQYYLEVSCLGKV